MAMFAFSVSSSFDSITQLHPERRPHIVNVVENTTGRSGARIPNE
jgi:hypothetical protein